MARQAKQQLRIGEVAQLLIEDGASWLGREPQRVVLEDLWCEAVYTFSWGSLTRHADQFDGHVHDVVVVKKRFDVEALAARERTKRHAVYRSDDPNWQAFVRRLMGVARLAGRCKDWSPDNLGLVIDRNTAVTSKILHELGVLL